MARRKKRGALNEWNRSLELITELVRIGSPLLEKLFSHQAPVTSPPPVTPSAVGISFTPYDIFRLPKNAGERRFTQRYRELMGKVHSDKGGSDVLAKIVNAARDEIWREQGWK